MGFLRERAGDEGDEGILGFGSEEGVVEGEDAGQVGDVGNERGPN